MSDLYQNKKHFSEFASGIIFTVVIALTFYLFGHWKGQDKVQKEAIGFSYGMMSKDGFQWKSKRRIIIGD